MSNKLQKTAQSLDRIFEITRNYQNKRFEKGETTDGKRFKQKDGLTNLTKKEWKKEANNWIKNNPKEWKAIRANNKYPFTKLQSMLSPVLGEMYWDKDGEVTKSGKGKTYTLYNAGEGGNYASAKADDVRKGSRGVQKRNQASITYSKQDFIDWGKRNGYSTKESLKTYNNFKLKNKAQASSGTSLQHNDHNQPNQSQFNNPGETYRNKLQIGDKLNLKKSNKMMTLKEMKDSGIPTSKTAAIAAEFNQKPEVSNKSRLNIIKQIIKDKDRPTATQNNIRLNEALNRRQLFMKSGGYGPFNTNVKMSDGKSLADLVNDANAKSVHMGPFGAVYIP